MEKTHTLDIDFGILGECEVVVVARFVPGEKGSTEAGRKMEPDFEDGWEILDARCEEIPNLDRFRREDESIDAALHDAMEVQYG